MLETKDVNKDVVFTVQLKPETVEVDARIGPDADEAEAFDLCERLLDAVRGFNQAGAVRS